MGSETKQSRIEDPCSKLQGIFDPQGRTIYSNRSLTPQQATGNALAPGFNQINELRLPPLLNSCGGRLAKIAPRNDGIGVFQQPVKTLPYNVSLSAYFADILPFSPVSRKECYTLIKKISRMRLQCMVRCRILALCHSLSAPWSPAHRS